MKVLFNEIKKTLQSELAAIKLFIIREGLNIDGVELKKNIEGYPEKYRTKRSIKKTALKDGYLVDTEKADVPWVPEEIFITVNGVESVVKTNYNMDSPFHIMMEKGSLFVCSRELELQIPCRLSMLPGIEQLKINEFTADQFLQIIGSDRIGILGYDGCSGWFRGKQCRFCDSCASRPGEDRARPSLNDLHNKYADNIKSWLDDVQENYISGIEKAYRFVHEHVNIVRHCHLLVMAGNLDDTSLEWEYMLNLSNAISAIKPLSEIDSYLNLIPPKEEKYLKMAKDSGYRHLIFNLEVFGDKAYQKVCPGKHALIPYKMFLERLEQAAILFGSGQVRCGFVMGAQPIEDLKAGIIYLAKRGVASDYTVFTPKIGTPWHKHPKPDILQVAQLSKFLALIYKDYGFKPLYCSLSSRSSIMNECYDNGIS